jgi:hypothetical protein
MDTFLQKYASKKNAPSYRRLAPKQQVAAALGFMQQKYPNYFTSSDVKLYQTAATAMTDDSQLKKLASEILAPARHQQGVINNWKKYVKETKPQYVTPG